MPEIFNYSKLEYALKDAPVPEFAWHTAYLDRIVKSDILSFDVRSLDPGKYSYPYHSHRNAEELMVIFEGKAMLRTPEGFKEVIKGDILFFEKGPSGAHQLHNHTNEPCLYLDIRTKAEIDVCDYPDSGKVNILPFREIYKGSQKTQYFDGEENVEEKWKSDKE